MIFYLVIIAVSTGIGVFMPRDPFATPEECRKEAAHIAAIAKRAGDTSNGFFCIGKQIERTHDDQAPNS